jgi:hypothetical protein
MAATMMPAKDAMIVGLLPSSSPAKAGKLPII